MCSTHTHTMMGSDKPQHTRWFRLGSANGCACACCATCIYEEPDCWTVHVFVCIDSIWINVCWTINDDIGNFCTNFFDCTHALHLLRLHRLLHMRRNLRNFMVRTSNSGRRKYCSTWPHSIGLATWEWRHRLSLIRVMCIQCWKYSDYICRNNMLNGLVDTLYI